MLVGSFEAWFSFGLLVVAAPESTDAHDGWDAAAEMVHAGPDSLYVGVRDTASGLVRVSCFEGDEPQSEFPLLFSGSLSLPSKRLRICDPDETISMVLPAAGDSVTVAVYADDSDEPSELQIYLNVQGDRPARNA
jgi:hypothetical protein